MSMNFRLALASGFTLFALAGFFASVVFAALYLYGFFPIYLPFILIALINMFFWFISPAISDFIYMHFYSLRWLSPEELPYLGENVHRLLGKVTREHNFKMPKIGVIEDNNPNAFTYGSTRSKARIVLTKGIFKYLNEEEVEAVVAHELGHIVNYDFIIMTIASTVLQLLYEAFIILTRVRSRGKNPLPLLGYLSFIFYWIGSYLILYLSRVREYYADEFSARVTGNPNLLSGALIKIGYGILTNPDDTRLIRSVEKMGIINFQIAKNSALAYYTFSENTNALRSVFLYDLFNPWAFISELRSTHPLNGKRLKKLSKIALEMGATPLFDFSEIESMAVDKGRLYRNFLLDLIMVELPLIALVLFPLIFLYFYGLDFLSTGAHFYTFLGYWLIVGGFALVIRTLYRFPVGGAEYTHVIDLLSDMYTSPVRGRSVNLEGEVIGRGTPGFTFCEDVMIQDSTGLMYVNYESAIPVIGNWFFAFTKVQGLINHKFNVYGWFFRGKSPRLDLRYLEKEGEIIKGRIRLNRLVLAVIVLVAGMVLALPQVI